MLQKSLGGFGVVLIENRKVDEERKKLSWGF
jgi:hypothetical protein